MERMRSFLGSRWERIYSAEVLRAEQWGTRSFGSLVPRR